MKRLIVFVVAALLAGATLAQSSSSQPAPGLMPRGTAALPGMYFAGDRDTGLYWPSANQAAITAGGTQRALFDSNGVTLTQISGTPFINAYRTGTPATSKPLTIQDVAGTIGRRLSIEADTNSGAEIELLPGPTNVSGSSIASQILLYNKIGTNYERFGFSNVNDQYIIDSTYNNAGTPRNIYIQTGGRVDPTPIASRNAAVFYNDASVDLHGSSYSADGKTWGATRLRVVDPGNAGDVRMKLDTRTGTPSSNAADSASVEYSRGGAKKWTTGLNFMGGNVDSFDVASAANRSVRFHEINNAVVLEFAEEVTTDPPAPAANRARLFIRDSGGGQTQVAAITSAGGVQVFGTLAGTETLTNKTIALGSNTVSGTAAQFSAALTDGDFATLAGTETLTNKTLTAPAINDGTTNLDGGTLIVPFAAAPAQTAEGSLVWDSDDDRITVGDGAGRKTFRPMFTGTATYDPASLAAGASRCDAVTVTGITTTGGAVTANIGAVDPDAGCVVASVRASAADTVRICWHNAVDAVTACDTASSTWTFSQPQ